MWHFYKWVKRYPGPDGPGCFTIITDKKYLLYTYGV